MSGSNGAISLAPSELPLVKCPKCGGSAKLVAYDKSGAPLVACSTPGCKGNWTNRHPTPSTPIRGT